MSNAETKAATKTATQDHVQELKPEVQELTAADAEQVRGGHHALLSHGKHVKIDF